MRVSVPTNPQVSGLEARSALQTSPAEAIDRICQFLSAGSKITTITGAGVSVDSGIRAYRGKDGRYMNPNYKPIFYHELMDQTEKGFAYRQRYWLRSYLGYRPIRDALPNRTHTALAALMHTGHISRLITQNVDGLHHKALSKYWSSEKLEDRLLELHGTLHGVRCAFGHSFDRDAFQNMLSAANPQWKAFLDELQQGIKTIRTNPDGDVAIEGVSYEDYVVPDCPKCLLENRRNSVHKPDLIFFGESIPTPVRERSFADIDTADRLFVIGTTLATYSAFRLVKRALQAQKPILLLNVGPTRADTLPDVEKIELPSGMILRDVVKGVLGLRALEDPVVMDLLSTGVYMPPLEKDPSLKPATVVAS